MTGGPQPIPLRCPRCAAEVAPEQDWCLVCGAAARTRLAPTPNWKLPVAVLAVIALMAGVALAVAFVELTNDDGPVTQASTAAAPAEPNAVQTTDTVPVAPPVSTTTPAATATTPPTTVSVPTVTATVPTTTTPPTVPTTPTVPSATAP